MSAVVFIDRLEPADSTYPQLPLGSTLTTRGSTLTTPPSTLVTDEGYTWVRGAPLETVRSHRWPQAFRCGPPIPRTTTVAGGERCVS
jgi:hypothetical protein